MRFNSLELGSKSQVCTLGLSCSTHVTGFLLRKENGLLVAPPGGCETTTTSYDGHRRRQKAFEEPTSIDGSHGERSRLQLLSQEACTATVQETF